MPERRFATPKPIQLSVNNGAGTIEIVATDTAESTVVVQGRDGDGAQAAEETEISFSEQTSRLTVQPPDKRFGNTPPLDIRIVLPAGSTAKANSGSADISVQGRLAGIAMNTGSGNLEAGQVDGDAELKAGSGDIRLGPVAGEVDAKSGSGNIQVDRAAGFSASSGSGNVRIGAVDGSTDIKGASGNISIGAVDGPTNIKGASGNVSIGSARRGAIVVTTASGDVEVGVAAGAVARLAVSSISGEVSSDLPVEDRAPEGDSAVDLRLNTVSGNVSVIRAARPETG
jgi:DUF4097 and DUF4098 domain-containing protein YvlB